MYYPGEMKARVRPVQSIEYWHPLGTLTTELRSTVQSSNYYTTAHTLGTLSCALCNIAAGKVLIKNKNKFQICQPNGGLTSQVVLATQFNMILN